MREIQAKTELVKIKLSKVSHFIPTASTQPEHNGRFKLEKEEAMNGLNTLIVINSSHMVKVYLLKSLPLLT